MHWSFKLALVWAVGMVLVLMAPFWLRVFGWDDAGYTVSGAGCITIAVLWTVALPLLWAMVYDALYKE